MPEVGPAPVATETDAWRAINTLVAAPLALWLLILAGNRAFAAVIESGALGDDDRAVVGLFTVLLYGGMLLCGWIGGRLFGVRPLHRGAQPARALAIGSSLGAFGMLVCLAVCVFGDAVLLGGGSPQAGFVWLALLLSVLQVLAEEVVFRGWVQPVLAETWGPAMGVSLSALAFALLHLAGGAEGFLTIANLFLGGLVMGLLALRSGGILASFAFHYVWNVSEESLFGLVPNPGSPVFGSLVDLDLAGPEWLGGGPQGLNASVAMTAALVLVLAVIALAGARDRTTRPVAST
ncbi:CPBP family intramembrane glutamic endopeptidase [Novosphingobium aquimarinum]|uniref:CPBP family intramembrane glutamic endopeptidase n=1 Tax=Novosphingobium aquimarinum TaxID=2682494 RepID=UPI0012EBC4BF|nr:type II CAAX endopeptidase family protein [Novosphingobium aquimarinum]